MPYGGSTRAHSSGSSRVAINAALARADEVAAGSRPGRSRRFPARAGADVLPTTDPAAARGRFGEGGRRSYVARRHKSPRSEFILWLRLLGVRNAAQLFFELLVFGERA